MVSIGTIPPIRWILHVGPPPKDLASSRGRGQCRRRERHKLSFTNRTTQWAGAPRFRGYPPAPSMICKNKDYGGRKLIEQ
jgi:hypothetical protein